MLLTLLNVVLEGLWLSKNEVEDSEYSKKKKSPARIAYSPAANKVRVDTSILQIRFQSVKKIFSHFKKYAYYIFLWLMCFSSEFKKKKMANGLLKRFSSKSVLIYSEDYIL